VPGDLSTADAQYEFLLDHDVFVEDDEGAVATTEAYDATRGIYHDSYAYVDDETFHGTVASLFGLTPEEAAEQVEELGITRSELVAYLALDSYLDDVVPDADVAPGVLVQMAGMVAGVAPESPVPDVMPELTDEDYEAFLEDNPDAVVFVWKLHCGPCDEMKVDLEAILEAVPDDVGVAGVDGEAVAAFREQFEVTAAPATLTFADGAFVECVEGRRTPDQLSEMFANAFGSSPALE
jgi:thiol-disulfide isomerase/thioredoxin